VLIATKFPASFVARASSLPATLDASLSAFRGKGLAEAVRVNAVLREVAERYDRTPAQVALRWLIQQDGVLPIPGAKTGPQAEQNAGALAFTLTDAEVEALRRA
jgi:aryl-alcohol dehydrogenase-like predicted oxidoreductase